MIEDDHPKLKARDRVACHLYIKVFALKAMRKHVEITLRRVEVRDFHSCGKFKAAYNADRTKPLWMVWIGRMLDTLEFKDSSPASRCTNIFLSIVCPVGLNEQRQTFWKYNFIQHMVEKHLTNDSLLPLCPPELIVSGHIYKAEE